MNKKIENFTITLDDIGISEFPTWNALEYRHIK